MQRKRNAAFTLIELLVVIAIIAVLAALLFPVFASVREKGWQATCLSNLKQIGFALEMYLQDYDERMPDNCWWARASAILNNPGPCQQDGITGATPKDKYLPAPQSPPRFIQDKLDPYIRNPRIWFCPSVGINRTWNDDPTRATLGFNGTTYMVVYSVVRGSLWAPPSSKTLQVSGLPLAAIPRLAEAAVVYDYPDGLPIKPCANPKVKPTHAKGLNALYADTHARYSPFSNQPSRLDPCYSDYETDNGWQGYFE
jgi:prepilin-type N-terminal cleavage/methylation domain-containing protein/prepilin-type processing-associated H-X9-DG protein